MKKIGLALATFALVALAGCDEDTRSAADRARAQNVAAQEDIISRATAAVPVPRLDVFLARENLAKLMTRQNDPAKTWYVYVLGNNGAKLGYYVSSTYPQTICTFMTPPQEIRYRSDSSGRVGNVVNAPALDGVYYDGGGCDTYFFFDVNSDALIQITGMKLWTSDVPLNLDAPRIEVAS